MIGILSEPKTNVLSLRTNAPILRTRVTLVAEWVAQQEYYEQNQEFCCGGRTHDALETCMQAH